MAIQVPMDTLEKVEYQDKNTKEIVELNELGVDGCEWRKPYVVTIPTNIAGVDSVTVTIQASESNCGQLSTTSITRTDKVLYGDTVSVVATPSIGYNNPVASFSSGVTNGKVTDNVVLNITAGSLITGWQTIFSGSTTRVVIRDDTGVINTTSTTGFWTTQASKIRITGNYTLGVEDGGTAFSEEVSVSYSSTNNNYEFSTNIGKTSMSFEYPGISYANIHTLNLDGSMEYTAYSSGQSLGVLTLTITSIELYI